MHFLQLEALAVERPQDRPPAFGAQIEGEESRIRHGNYTGVR